MRKHPLRILTHRLVSGIFNLSRDSLSVVRLKPLIDEIRLSPDFPGSAGSQRQWLNITLAGLQSTFPAMSELLKAHPSFSFPKIRLAEELFKVDSDARELRKILDSNGSDKGYRHGYELIYANLMPNRRAKSLSILEIGLGTNNADTPSNMGKNGKPGASLRAWAEFFPNATIVGCDIDSRILFEEDRIKTFQLDQTSIASWEALKTALFNQTFDIIIDDGLHAPYANLRTILETTPLIRRGGYLVIEDVREEALTMWNVVALILEATWEFEVIRCSRSHMILLRKT